MTAPGRTSVSTASSPDGTPRTSLEQSSGLSNKSKRASYKDADYEDEEEGLEIGDEEENVGLMQQDRDGPTKERVPSTSPRSRATRTRVLGCIAIAILIALLLALVPFLGWLSSSDSAGSDRLSNFRGSIKTITVPAHWNQPNKHYPPASSLADHGRPDQHGASNKHAGVASSQRPFRNKFKASSNDGRGLWGLAGAKASVAFDFAIKGWNTRVEAAHSGKASLVSALSDGEALKFPTMDEVFAGNFRGSSSDIKWCAEDPDVGVFSHVDEDGNLIIQDVTSLRKEKTGKGEVAKGGGKVTYVQAKDVKDEHGRVISWSSFKISPDMRYVLFFSATESQWRYSSHSNVWIFDVMAKRTHALGGSPTSPPKIAVASWAPKWEAGGMPPVAFVKENNLYVAFAPGKEVQVTKDGAESIFNGVPDWAYEEEVYSGDTTFWWSPDGRRIAFLRLDETKVPIFGVPVYNPTPTPGAETPYLTTIDIKYPKPGYDNPTVSTHLVDVEGLSKGKPAEEANVELKSPSASLAEPGQEHIDLAIQEAGGERLVTEVKWVGASHLLVKETNRQSDAARIINYDLGAGVEGRVTRRWESRREGGWIDAVQVIVPLADRKGAPNDTTAYLDVIPDKDGFKHIAFFASASASEPLFLTFGRWEVDEVLHTDVEKRKVYFTAARPHHTQRHIFSVALPDLASPDSYKVADAVPLTDVSQPGTYKASFDPKGAYYLLSYLGPEVPTMKVLGLTDPSFSLVLEDNAELSKKLASYVRPTSVFYNVTTPDGIEVTVHELRPSDFDASGETRYPVLVNVYGGPDSQMAKTEYALGGWHYYVVASMGYIVAYVDGRGTGWKGRPYRNVVTGHLGLNEATDVVGAARILQRLPYVDEDRIGVWGWSYGGYLTSKVVERDSGVFSLGMAVAPVADWRFYDTIYTERYMKLLDENRAGYDNSSVSITDGFRHSSYLLAQGTGDTNVHFQASASLLDKLEVAHVRDFAFRMFPDSDHSISTRGQYRELHSFLTRFLAGQWGPGGRRRFVSEAVQPPKSQGRLNMHVGHAAASLQEAAQTMTNA